MAEPTLTFAPQYGFQAYHLAETLNLREIDGLFSDSVISRSSRKLVCREDKEGYYFIYRFGSVVFFGVGAIRQNQIIEKIRTIAGGKEVLTTSEELMVSVQKGAETEVLFEKVILDRLSFDRVDVLALTVARSAALEYFELTVDDLLRENAKITNNLRTKGRMQMNVMEINKFIGSCMLAKHDLVSSMYLLDPPEEVWDDQVLDNLYRASSDMFELRERYKTVEYKLKLMQDSLEIIADLLKNRRATILELTVILLIFMCVVLWIYEILR